MKQFFKFNPILKEKIWGGERLMRLFNKKSDRTDIGESWEISNVEGDISVVSEGKYQGKTLRFLLKEFKTNLVGHQVYEQFGDNFPLLIKFIDAKEKLSIQLHPNDELSKKRHNSFGKTEMWYIMDAEKDGDIIVGFKEDSNEKEYLTHLNNKTLLEILNVDKVKKGDVYYIPTGRIHAIGSGVLLAEIQQTSDITYRVYDWDRVDNEGNYRELHTELAIDAIDYKAEKSYNLGYHKTDNISSELVHCPYFKTNILPLSSKITVNHKDKDSFVIYMCVDGCVEFSSEIQKVLINKGETILVPACLKEFEINPLQVSELLEVFM